MKRIDGRARTVRELLDGARYTIDFYQREYAWEERQVRELVDDLSGKFLDFWDEGHPRSEVERYGHYFLGSIVISHKRGRRFIVDGQQRLTTLTLLLIDLHHRQRAPQTDGAVDVRNLIFSEKYGRRSFNLDVPDREGVMDALFSGNRFTAEGASESVVNIAARYANIADHLPDEITGPALPYFVDWLLENVHLVEIEAYSDEDAYTIFETMNDRGLSLSLPEMLKGYVLANIQGEDDQRVVNDVWKGHIHALKALGNEEDVDFFKNWLRARHAETIRPGRAGAENRDYERIGSEFHRWVRDKKEAVGLAQPDDFVRFVRRDLDFYARQNLVIRQAANALTEGLESIYFNENRGFTLQTQVLLAALEPGEPSEVTRRKLALVADYLDIWMARRVWNHRTIAYSSVRYTLFNLTRELRGRDLPALSRYLREQLDAQPETFAGNPAFRLHQVNLRQVRHILARLTHWVDTECGRPSHFEDLVSQGRARAFEIEHIWPNHHERFVEHYSTLDEFEVARNQLGALLLLQRGINQSLGDADYEAKRDVYMAKGRSLMACAFHPLAYEKDPAFRQFLERTGLHFRPYDRFGPDEQQERQELLIRLAEWVWNPSRLDLGGPSPPEHLPIGVSQGASADRLRTGAHEPYRYKARMKFWTQLLTKAAERTDLHRAISPGRDSWVGTRSGLGGCALSYLVRTDHSIVELYIDTKDRRRNKAIFDRLYEQRTGIEGTFGGSFEWHRLDDKRASVVRWRTNKGGWMDESSWPAVQEEMVDAMIRFDAAFRPSLLETLEATK